MKLGATIFFQSQGNLIAQVMAQVNQEALENSSQLRRIQQPAWLAGPSHSLGTLRENIPGGFAGNLLWGTAAHRISLSPLAQAAHDNTRGILDLFPVLKQAHCEKKYKGGTSTSPLERLSGYAWGARELDLHPSM